MLNSFKKPNGRRSRVSKGRVIAVAVAAILCLVLFGAIAVGAMFVIEKIHDVQNYWEDHPLFAINLAKDDTPNKNFDAAGHPKNANASANANANAQAAAAPARPPYVGEWLLAYIETDGVKIVGDAGQALGFSGPAGLSIGEQGTAVLTMGSNRNDCTWVQKAPDSIELTYGSGAKTSVVCQGGALAMSGDEGVFVFTADGRYPGLEDIASLKWEPIDSEQPLMGSWNLSCVEMAGITLYGDSADLARKMGLTGASCSFEAGGKCTFMGAAHDYSASQGGAFIVYDGMSLPVKAVGGKIVVDMTTAYMGTPTALVFSR